MVKKTNRINEKVKNSKFEIQTISMIEKTVRIGQAYWSVDEIHELLQQLERDKWFKGFVKINFEIGSLPEITYLIDISKLKGKK